MVSPKPREGHPTREDREDLLRLRSHLGPLGGLVHLAPPLYWGLLWFLLLFWRVGPLQGFHEIIPGHMDQLQVAVTLDGQFGELPPRWPSWPAAQAMRR